MPSTALTNFTTALAEIGDLAGAYPTHPSLAANPLARAIGRAGTVLLSSHFERYFYSVNEEACSFVVTTCSISGDRLGEGFRLIHSKGVMDTLAETSWEKRSAQYAEFVRDESWLWSVGATGNLHPDRILTWMKAPKPANLIRFYKYWGIENIFESITRTPQTRGRFFLLVRELVDKRNNIAHGDLTAEAPKSDFLRYLRTARDFCGRADRVFARRLGQLTQSPRPW